MAFSHNGRTIKRADPSTIHDKFLVGYQGWFTCAGDGEPVGPGHHGWLHWFSYPVPDGGRPNFDIWPDVSEYTPSELFPAPGLKYSNGEQAFLFSSRHPKTVQRHFHWMARHGVDGAFLQRFAGQCDIEQGNEGIRKIRDEVGDRVMGAAEKEGRVFAIMYDVSGVAPDRIQHVLEHDWIHLIRRKAILDSPAYLREQGRSVVALWGFGMSDAHHSPATVRAVARFIRANTPGGAYIMAGVPAHWRTSVMDADSDPEFVRVWMEEFDAISPWTVGRYSDDEGADRFEQEKIKGDVEFIRAHNERWETNRAAMRKVDYIPTIFPGGSGFNLSEGNWKWNDCARRGGHFMWRQLYNVRRHNVRTIYGAMWDEYDEGTALMPVVSHKRQLPVLENYRFMALDEDGFDLPPDWYMRICGFAAEGLRGERLILGTFPSKELQDYWSSRPRYEDEASSSAVGGSGTSSREDKGQTWEEWDKVMEGKGCGNEPPPPPYSLEVDEPQVQAVASNAPPAIPLARRPSTQAPTSPTVPLNTRPVPPAVNAGARPPSLSGPPSGSRPPSHTSSPQPSPHLVPADEFSRLGLSSIPPSPGHGQAQYALYSHSHSPSPHHSPQPIYSAYSHASSHSTSGPSFPTTEPGFSFPTPSAPAPAGTSGPWSQAPWPPPEWSSPQGPTTLINQFFHGGDSLPCTQTATQHHPGYSPSYGPTQSSTATPPPLRPRPSVSSGTRPPPSPSNNHAGGFAFPEVHVLSANAPNSSYSSHNPGQGLSYSGTDSSPYNPQPSPYTTEPNPGSSESSNSFPYTAGPAEGPSPRPHGAPYGNTPIPGEFYSPIPPDHHQPALYSAPSPPAHYSSASSPAPAPTPYGPLQGQGSFAPQAPPAHPATSYGRPPGVSPGYGGGGAQNQPGAGSAGGPLGSALNLVGNVAGQGAKNQLQNLANSGTKLFGKYRR